VTLALGGDCLADVALLRGEPGLYGRVASDPTVSRTIATLAADAPAALAAINTARAVARARVWELAGKHAPDHDADARRSLVVDLDATLVTSDSDKDHAAATSNRCACSWTTAPRGLGAPGVAAAPGKRLAQHRDRPHHSHQGCVDSAAVGPQGAPGRSGGADPRYTPPEATTTRATLVGARDSRAPTSGNAHSKT
jgi:predicted lipoprotein with Yx(FWY)xxD motif